MRGHERSSEVIGSPSRARRLERTVLILARFHADGDEPIESISTVEVRRDGDTDGDTDGDSGRSDSSAARADIRLSGMGEADEEGTGEGELGIRLSGMGEADEEGEGELPYLEPTGTVIFGKCTGVCCRRG